MSLGRRVGACVSGERSSSVRSLSRMSNCGCSLSYVHLRRLWGSVRLAGDSRTILLCGATLFGPSRVSSRDQRPRRFPVPLDDLCAASDSRGGKLSPSCLRPSRASVALARRSTASASRGSSERIYPELPSSVVMLPALKDVPLRSTRGNDRKLELWTTSAHRSEASEHGIRLPLNRDH